MLVSVLGVTLAAFGLFGGGFPAFVSAPVYVVARPVWGMARFAKKMGGNLFAILHTKAALVRENRALRIELQELEWTLLDHDRLREDNETLRRLSGALAEPSRLAAHVIAKPGMLPYDSFIVDVGYRDGVAPGDRVIVGADVIVGTILETRGRLSRGQFISSPGIATTVLLGAKAIPFEAHGAGGGTLSIAVPRDLPVAEGDHVFLPAVPRLFLGMVDRIDVRPENSLKTLFVRLPVNLFEISSVSLLRAEYASSDVFDAAE